MSFFGNIDIEDITKETFISLENQTVFTLSKTYSIGKNKLQVYISGVRQFSPTNFTETNETTITLSEPIPSGLTVVVLYL